MMAGPVAKQGVLHGADKAKSFASGRGAHGLRFRVRVCLLFLSWLGRCKPAAKRVSGFRA